MNEGKNREQGFGKALRQKNIPLLILDQKWHHLFLEDEKPKKIKKLEKELNQYLARQGQLNQELKELRKLKKKLMDNILVNMDEIGEDESRIGVRKVREDKRLITDINAKLETYSDELQELPKLMEDVNRQLMAETMEFCYGKMRANESEREELGQWIDQMRIELKKKVIRKQNIEDQNKEIYTYMHDIFGAGIIEIFDLKYGDESEEEGQSYIPK